MGDDDLLSISLARRGVEVTLVEIDPYTCALVTLIARSEGLPIRVVQCDLRDPLPIDIGVFDLFVADPDFTIEAFALFLSRGLSGIRTGGIGLINFEATRSQAYRAEYLLERLNVEVLSKPQEMWSYVVLSNVVATGGHVSAKYVSVDYSKRVCLAEAPYRSVMFVIRKNPETMVALPPDATLMAPDSVIYDL
ncbi:MAG: bis-aminopropyl spermidine synthase family protein [Candidatus Thorarchaeota archaeon]